MYIFVISIPFTIPPISLKKRWLNWQDSKPESFSFESGSTNPFMPHEYRVPREEYTRLRENVP